MEEKDDINDIVRERQRRKGVIKNRKHRVKKKDDLKRISRKKMEPRKEVDWDLFHELCRIQCTVTEICAKLDIGKGALYKKVEEKFKMPFHEYFLLAKSVGKVNLRSALMGVGLNALDPKILVFLAKNYLGMSDKTDVTINDSDEIINTKSSELDDMTDDQKIELLNFIEGLKNENET